MSNEEQLSQKNGTLVSIFQLGGYVREVGPIVEHLRKLGISSDGHNVAHVLWPLSKESKVQFLERKERGKSFLTNIRITERGAQTARDLLGIEEVRGSSRVPAVSGSGRGTHPVGRDDTDFRQHSTVAEGGPIERTVQKETMLDSVPFVILPEEEARVYRETPSRGRPLKPSNGEAQDSHIDVETAAEVITPPAEVEEKPAEAASSPAMPDTPTQYTDVPYQSAPSSAPEGVVIQPLAMADFPHIAAVLAKQEKVSRYQRAAELLGDDEAEIAIQLLEKVKISPLEEEIIRLLG